MLVLAFILEMLFSHFPRSDTTIEKINQSCIYTNTSTVSSDISLCVCLGVCIQVESEFILESERDSFIEQVREVIENADEKGLERDVEKQVCTTLSPKSFTLRCF